MINYIIQVILFQLLFVLIYDLLLSKETFFTKNRCYLLSTALISFLLPFFKVTSFQKVVSKENIIILPEVILSPQKTIERTSVYQSVDYIELIYFSGVALFLLFFVFKVIKIVRLIVENEKIKENNYSLIVLPKGSKAFSFFNFIFIGKEISKERRKQILVHELVHCKQKHTIDLLFFELLKIVMWFNPILYIYQKRITTVHEFIADKIVSESANKKNYIDSLISEVFQVEKVSFVNQFYKESLIKKRIMMMNTINSKKEKQLKYLLLVPLLILMVFYASCATENEDFSTQKKQEMIVYLGSLDGEKVNNEKNTYMDALHGKVIPTTKEYDLADLTKEEKKEYDSAVKEAISKSFYDSNFRVFQGKNDRKVIYYDLIKAMETFRENKGTTEKATVSFASLDVAPTFPECETGDRDCFTKSMANFVKSNFNTEIANELGLSSGSKRVFVQFKIDTEGNVIDVKARAPHLIVKEQAELMMQKLPKFKPGKLNGEKVATKYTLPISFNIK